MPAPLESESGAEEPDWAAVVVPKRYIQSASLSVGTLVLYLIRDFEPCLFSFEDSEESARDGAEGLAWLSVARVWLSL